MTHNPSAQAQEYLEQAYHLQAKRSFSEALRAAKAALEIEPDWAEAHYVRGVSLEALGWHREAGRAYREAIRLDPAFGEAEQRLAALKTSVEADERILGQSNASLWKMLRDTWLSPSVRSFARYVPAAELKRPTIWVVVWILASSVIGLLLTPLQTRAMANVMSYLSPEYAGEFQNVPYDLSIYLTGLPCILVTVLVGSILGLAIVAGVYYGMARLFKGEGTFTETYFMLALVWSGSVIAGLPLTVLSLLLGLIPVVGPLLYVSMSLVGLGISIYSLVLLSMAMAAAHDLPPSKGFAVVWIPIFVYFLVICGCVGLSTMASMM